MWLPDEILQDRFVFWIHDSSTLCEAKLSLARLDKICCAAQSTVAQIKVVGDTAEREMNKAKQECDLRRRKKKVSLEDESA